MQVHLFPSDLETIKKNDEICMGKKINKSVHNCSLSYNRKISKKRLNIKKEKKKEKKWKKKKKKKKAVQTGIQSLWEN